ncbi:hypothetical protein NKJ19_30030, partial [Mesorhizobium sp. M0203]
MRANSKRCARTEAGAGKGGLPGATDRIMASWSVAVVCVKFCKMAWHCGDVGVSAAQPPCLAE